jgi:hypothetical protein
MALAMKVAWDKEGDGDKGGRQATAMRAMAMLRVMVKAMRLAGGKEDTGEGCKGNGDSNVRAAGKEEDGGQVDCDGDKEGNGNSNEGGRQATATAMKRVMAMATRVVGNKEGNDDGGKSNENSNKGGG